MGIFSISEALPLKNREMISFIGAGGKSTLLLHLARELASEEKKVIITTTTKMYRPGESPLVVEEHKSKMLEKLQGCFEKSDIATIGTSIDESNKIQGVDLSILEELFLSGIASYILVEADGAARKPLKGFAPYEPLIPPSSGLVFAILGADALGKEIREKNIHRSRLLCRVAEASEGESTSLRHIVNTLLFMINLVNILSPQAHIVPVINKADLIKDILLVRHIRNALTGITGVARLLFTDFTSEFPLKFVFKNSSLPLISCVILAAGLSSRMGSDKLQEKIGQQTILEHSIKNAGLSLVDDIILVTRPQSGLEQLLHCNGMNVNVKIVHNPSFRQGIASSVKTGVKAVNPLTQAVMFALGDQPFIPPEVYDGLIKSYYRYLPLSVVPYFQGQRGNPVIFDRRCWPQLISLQGDKGGSQIFSALDPRDIINVKTSSPGILQDIDTPADLFRYTDK